MSDLTKEQEKVADFLAGIYSEGVSYYFTEYASATSVFKQATEAGIDPKLADKLCQAAVRLDDAMTDIQELIDLIAENADLEEEDYVC